MLLDRRRFLTLSGRAAVASALPLHLSFADAPTERRFVLIQLRGALDGLAAVPPLGDVDYAEQRGSLALSAAEALPLNGFYGLHPALESFAAWFAADEALVVHAVATPYRERSHFDAQDLLENGGDRPHALKSGWVNRILVALGGEERLGLSANQQVPLVLRGDAPVASWSPEGLPRAKSSFLEALGDLYAEDPLLAPALADGLQAERFATAALVEQDAELRGLVRLADGVGRLLAEPKGPRLAVLDLSGWDTHNNQGTVRGRLARSLTQLDKLWRSLRTGLGPVWEQTVTLVVTEFGRTVRANGSGGTDHGTASVALLAGGALAGGRVEANWPGLAEGALLAKRDLAPTCDLRAVLKGVAGPHLGLSTRRLDSDVFPNSADVRPLEGLVRG